MYMYVHQQIKVQCVINYNIPTATSKWFFLQFFVGRFCRDIDNFSVQPCPIMYVYTYTPIQDVCIHSLKPSLHMW